MVDRLAPVSVGVEQRFGRAAEVAELLGVPGLVVTVDWLAPVSVGAERRLGRAAEAAELWGVPLTITPLSELH